MKHILLPTDFSPNAYQAISYALQLFKDEVCTFFLLHTYTPVVYNADYMQSAAAQFEIMDAVKTASLDGLKRVVNKIEADFSNPKHHIKTLSAFNTLTQEIKNVVSKHHINYVVMGTQGATGAKEILFGSNTVHAFKDATCPVLAVPATYNFQKPKDILFSTDYEITYQDKNIQPFAEIAKLHGAKLHSLHVSFGHELTALQKENKAALQTMLSGLAHQFHNVRDEAVSSAIMAFQKETPVQMLAMINNKHSFFENLFFKSRINQIGFHIKIPFLVIPSYR
ncbi:universal stress protein [Bizionia sediminis]|uniref:Universal stress protein n=1 Tax=Bizionia sediminis TaxID=1737064 RepID=A0ABW5KVK0_9FLAO